MRLASLWLFLAACAPDRAAPPHADPDAGWQGGGPPGTSLPPDPCASMTVVEALYKQPRLLAPLSTSRSTTRQPVLSWELACADNADLQICADVDCDEVLSTTAVSGGEHVPPAPLSGHGDVYFWRVRPVIGRQSGLWSKTWQVVVPTSGTPAFASGGSVLDVELDGLADHAVSSATDNAHGAVHVYGPSAQTLTQPDPDPGAVYGGSLASAGDVDGDGYPELLVGANNADEGPGVGAAYLYYGSREGYVSSPVVLTGPAAASAFGYSVSGAGDVNADGYGDFLVGAPAYGADKVGAAYLYLGRHRSLRDHEPASFELFGTGTPGAEFGIEVSGVGDLDGDGYSDLAVGESYFEYWVGAHPAGHALVWYGGPEGPAGAPTDLVSPTSVGGDGFGFSISGAADLDGDGLHDLVVGAGGADNANGAVFVWYGDAAGLGAAPDESLAPLQPVSGFFGHELSATGDLNGDGVDDLAVGETDADRLRGQVELFLSDSQGIGPVTVQDAPSASSSYFGSSVAILGDVDGDALDDFGAGSPFSDGGDGEAYLFLSDGSVGALGPTGDGFGRFQR